MSKRDGLIRIGEFAKVAESNLRTLRYYEEIGLLKPAYRSEGGFRYYARDQLERMAAIKRFQDLGLSLKEISAAITVEQGGADVAVTKLRKVVQAQIDLIESKIDGLQRDLTDLRESRRKLVETCQWCDTEFTKENCDPCPRSNSPMPALLRALLD